MKRLIYVLNLVFFAFHVQMKAQDNSDLETKVLNHHYVGITLSDDGLIENISGDCLSLLFWDRGSIEGLIYGAEYFISGFSQYVTIEFYPFNLEFSNNEIKGFISPAAVFQDDEGNKEIKPVDLSIYSRDPYPWVYFSKREEGDSEYYVWSINVDRSLIDYEYFGLATFIYDETGGYKVLNNYLELSGKFTETDSGVQSLISENKNNADAPVYDLYGRIVDKDNLSPGIYIHNGRKIIKR